MTHEEIINMTWEERHKYFQKLNEGTEEFEDPIANMTSEEADAYFESLGFKTWEEFNKEIMNRLSDGE